MTQQMLIVEDDDVFGQVLQRAMERRGYVVHRAVDLAQANALATAHAPGLAILDLKLEHESTLPLIPVLKEINGDIRILVLTGYASIATAVEAVKLGAINYLPKPSDVDEVLNALLADAPDPHLPLDEARMSVQRLEWEHIQKVLQENDGNISATARQLNMHRRTLQRKLQKRPRRD